MKIVSLLAALTVLASSVGIAQETSHKTPQPIIDRVDTRLFIGFRFASEDAVNSVLDILYTALPNEAGMCMYGYASDTTITVDDYTTEIEGDSTTIDRKMAIIDSVAPARIKDSGPQYVSYQDGIPCDPSPTLIGKAHSHPRANTPFSSCSHSDPDALFLSSLGTQYWFSFVFCKFSNELLWADGRRWTLRFGS